MTGRTGVTGSALLRLLHRLAGSEAGPHDANPQTPQQDFAQQLSLWLRWTDAIPLSAALDAPPEPLSPAPAESAELDAAQAHRVHESLMAAIAEDARAVAAMPAVTAPQDPKDRAADAAVCRQRYQSRQLAMAQSIERLRERLRARMARMSPELARLAAVDVVMEQVLGSQEQRLLAPLPAMLGRRFERLQRAEDVAAIEAAAAEAAIAEAAASEAVSADAAQGTAVDEAPFERPVARPSAKPSPGRRWLPAFSKDMQALLMAELEIRFHPVQGLVEALRQGQGIAPPRNTTTT